MTKEISTEMNTEGPPILEMEIRNAVKQMQPCMAQRPDYIITEMIITIRDSSIKK